MERFIPRVFADTSRRTTRAGASNARPATFERTALLQVMRERRAATLARLVSHDDRRAREARLRTMN